jgi:glutamyl/glutaminyl-tRNA synthetase
MKQAKPFDTGLWTRWAPTPSGYLHAGNAANALLTFALGRALGARVLLRIDDMDAVRLRQPYLDSIFRTLDALGLEPDAGPSGPGEMPQWSQQQRMPHYRQLLENLLPSGRVYACDCSRAQWKAYREARQRENAHATQTASPRPAASPGHPGQDAGHPGPCRQRMLQPGASASPGRESTQAWRLDSRAEQDIGWTELMQSGPGIAGARPETGPEAGPETEPPDPVLLRRDGLPAYPIASLSDDIHYGIGLIVRGADLLPSTATQISLARLLEPREAAGHFERAVFFHHPLLADRHGQKISKSAGNAAAPDLDLGRSNQARLCALAARWLIEASAPQQPSFPGASPASLTDLIAWIDEYRPFAPAALEALAYLEQRKNPS